jgi:hypothetical protein
MFPVVPTSTSHVSLLESEAESGSMPVAISASRFKQNGCRSLRTPKVAFICGGGCIVHVGGTLASQGEVLAGPILRF